MKNLGYAGQFLEIYENFSLIEYEFKKIAALIVDGNLKKLKIERNQRKLK